MQQPDGKEEVKAKSRGGGDGGATTGAMRQPAGKTRGKQGRHTRGKREGRRQRTRGGRAPRGREVAAARREAVATTSRRRQRSLLLLLGIAAPLARSLAMAAAATSPALSASSASAKSAHPPPLLSTPSHRCRRRPRWTRSAPFWRRRCPRPPSRSRRELVQEEQEANGRRRQWRRW